MNVKTSVEGGGALSVEHPQKDSVASVVLIVSGLRNPECNLWEPTESQSQGRGHWALYLRCVCNVRSLLFMHVKFDTWATCNCNGEGARYLIFVRWPKCLKMLKRFFPLATSEKGRDNKVAATVEACLEAVKTCSLLFCVQLPCFFFHGIAISGSRKLEFTAKGPLRVITSAIPEAAVRCLFKQQWRIQASHRPGHFELRLFTTPLGMST